jgi:hypothetical protein
MGWPFPALEILHTMQERNGIVQRLRELAAKIATERDHDS